MRLLAILSLLMLIAALVLNVLLLLAGSSTTFLEDVPIVTLNTSNVGEALVTGTASPVRGAINSAIANNPAASAVVAAAGPTASAIAAALVASQANSVAQAVGLHDYYNFHVRNWCEGYYEPYAYAANATQNTTSCGNTTALWDFNLTQIISSELRVGYLASQLNIPDAANEGFAVLQNAFKIMYIFYCVTIGASAVAILTGLAALALDGRMSACLNGIWAFINAACSIAASGIATAIMFAMEAVASQYHDQVGVSVTRGTHFLAMTWAASALLILTFFVWTVDCCVGGGDRRRRGNYMRANKQETYH